MLGTSSLRWYGSAHMQETDTGSPQGGGISLSRKVGFADLGFPGRVQIVADGSATATVTVTGRGRAGEIVAASAALQGQTPVVLGPTMARILKASKGASTAGRVAVEAATPAFSGTVPAAVVVPNMVQFPSGASLLDGAYAGMVLRLTGGTGAGQIRMITRYDGATRLAYTSEDWVTLPQAGTTFRVAPGLVFDRAPTEIMEVRQPFYAASPNTVVYEKVFVRALDPVASSVVVEVADPWGRITFALEPAPNGTGSTGNRLAAPGGLSFDSEPKAIGAHDPGDAWGVWLKMDAGSTSRRVPCQMREQGIVFTLA